MMMQRFFAYWLEHKTTTLFSFIILVVLIGLGLLQYRIGPNVSNSAVQFSVIIQHYGLDGEEIEESITTSLENLITRISGIREIRSISEQNKSRVNIILNPDTDSSEFYFALRQAVEILYKDLPPSVQRPQIFSSTTAQRPIMIVAYPTVSITDADITYDLIEKHLKSNIQKIRGVGEVTIGGGEPKEIHVILNNKKAQAYGITYQQLATTISNAYQNASVGLLETQSYDIPIAFKGRLGTLRDLENLIVPHKEKHILLKDIADVSYARRALEKISRVDSMKNITLYIKSSDPRYVVTAAKAVQQELAAFDAQYKVQSHVLYNQGRQVSKSVRTLCISLLQSMLVIVVFLLLCYRKMLLALSVSIFLPIEILATLAIISVMKINISIELLIGISIGIGLLTDTGVIIVNDIRGDKASAIPVKMARITPAIFASIVTTLIVMTPLLFLPEPTKTALLPIIIALALLMLITFLMHIIFFPPLYNACYAYSPASFKKAPRHYTHSTLHVRASGLSGISAGIRSITSLCSRLIVLLYNKSKISLVVSGVLVIAFFIAMFVVPKSTRSLSIGEKSIFGSIEYESGTSAIEVDKQSDRIAQELRKVLGVERVEILSNRNNARFSVYFDTKVTNQKSLIHTIREMNKQFPRASIFVSDITREETRIEIALLGPTIEHLRSYARDISAEFLSNPIVVQSILHFKKGDPLWKFDIDHSAALQKGISPREVSSFLRWHLYGPVSLKWIDEEEEKERDLRIKGEKTTVNTIGRVQHYTMPTSRGAVPLYALGAFNFIEKADTIFHLNKQRAVYFSLIVSENNIDLVLENIKKTLSEYALAKGYSYRIDTSLQKLKKQYSLLVLFVMLAICIVYMFLAGYYESFLTPLVIILGIPLSLSVIGIVYMLLQKTFSIYSLVAIIIVIGLVVNNIIIFIDKLLENTQEYNIMRALHARSKPLLITSFSTLLSLMPMVLGNSNATLVFEFAFVLSLGIIGSLTTTFFFIPAILKQYPKLLYRR